MIAFPTDSLRSLRPGAAETFDWQGRTVILRPLRREDARLVRVLAAHVAPADLDTFAVPGDDADALVASAQAAHTDATGATAFIAVDIDEDGHAEALGLVQALLDDEGEAATLVIALRPDVKGRRLGQRLVAKTLEVLQGHGLRRISTRVHAGDEPTRALLRDLGFVMNPRRVTPGRVVYVAPTVAGAR
jgi:acetyltransferase